MRWKKGRPTKPGMYLRNNPATYHVVRQDVVKVGEDLCTLSGDGALIRLATWPSADSFWWYGPIPRPPKIPKPSDPNTYGRSEDEVNRVYETRIDCRTVPE